jgi:hypothetical protein
VEFGKKAPAITNRDTSSWDSSKPSSGDSGAITPALLTVKDWGVVIASNGLFNGFFIDENDSSIKKAPRSAFQLNKALLDPQNFASARQVQEQQEKANRVEQAKYRREHFDASESESEDLDSQAEFVHIDVKNVEQIAAVPINGKAKRKRTKLDDAVSLQNPSKKKKPQSTDNGPDKDKRKKASYLTGRLTTTLPFRSRR